MYDTPKNNHEDVPNHAQKQVFEMLSFFLKIESTSDWNSVASLEIRDVYEDELNKLQDYLIGDQGWLSTYLDHDLNNDLTPLGVPLGSLGYEQYKEIQEGFIKSLSIILFLLQLRNLEAGKGNELFLSENISLEEMVKIFSIGIGEDEMQECGIGLSLKLDEEVKEREVSLSLSCIIIRILVSMIRNAKRHGNATQLSIDISGGQGKIEITVMNNGGEISNNMLETEDGLQKLFHEGESSAGSTGLGLSGIVSVLKQWQAQIEAQRSGFTINIPFDGGVVDKVRENTKAVAGITLGGK